MGDIYLRKYGVAATVEFALYATDGTALKTDAVSASGDVTLYRDGAGVETLDDDQFDDIGAVYNIDLSVAEMTAARIIVCIVDQTNPQAWLDNTLIIETYGNASAQHAFDLDTATQSVNITQIGGVAQSATDLKDFADTGYDPATHKVQGLVTCDTTTSNTDMITAATVNAQCDTALSDINLDHLMKTAVANNADMTTEVADGTVLSNIMSKTSDTSTYVVATDSLEGIVDVDLTPIKAITDTLVLTDIADAVLDEVVDTNAGINANSLRENINLIASVLAGKSSGGGTNTIVFRDLGDTKNRISATVDADGNRTAVGTQDGT